MTTPAPPTMLPERWRTVDRVMQDALACTRGHRDAFVAKSCGDDPALWNEVSSLLAAYDAMPVEFLERPAIAEHGLPSANAPTASTSPTASSAAHPQSRRMVSARLAVYAAAAGIVVGTAAGWKLAHSPRVERWQGALGAMSQPANVNGADDGGEPRAVASRESRLSPRKHWVAYTSNESGRDEVYVDSYPRPGHRITISRGGGTDPAWRADGREMYYWRGDTLMALPIDGSRGDRPPVLGAERVLLTRPASIP